MASDLRSVLTFLDEQKARQAPRFPSMKYEKVLSFMGTTSQPGQHAAMAVVPLGGLEPGGSPSEMRVRLRGPLPRPPAPGECIAVHITALERYQGYQVKTRALAAAGAEDALYRQQAADDLWLYGHQIFTVHHSPYTMKFFEQIPYDEVRQTVGEVATALVGVGRDANISPRFIFHYESKLDRLALYHGDGLPLKTYLNLRVNRQETRLVLDLDSFEGFALRGTVEEFSPHQHAQAYDKICRGFAAGSWGQPSRVFRLVADDFAPVTLHRPAR